MNKSTALITFLILAILPAGNVFATSLDQVQFIKISPKDAKAVIKGADGKLLVINPGDMIGNEVTVKEIAAGRIVLEEKTERGPETVIVRVENGRQRIERMRKQPEMKPLLVAPAEREK